MSEIEKLQQRVKDLEQQVLSLTNALALQHAANETQALINDELIQFVKGARAKLNKIA